MHTNLSKFIKNFGKKNKNTKISDGHFVYSYNFNFFNFDEHLSWPNNFNFCIFHLFSKTISTFVFIIIYSLHFTAKFIVTPPKSTNITQNMNLVLHKNKTVCQHVIKTVVLPVMLSGLMLWRSVSRFHEQTRFVYKRFNATTDFSVGFVGIFYVYY